MKTLLTTLAAVLVGFFALPNQAEARVHVSINSGYTYVSGHSSCGCPIYTKRVVRGYDGYRRPIYSYYKQPFRCRGGHGCRSSVTRYGHRGHFDRGYRHGYVRHERSHRGYSRGRGHYRGGRRSRSCR